MSFRRLTGCLVLSVLALVALGPFAPDGAVRADDEKPGGKKHALLIGITEYQRASLAPLEFTENDVEELGKILEQPGAGFTSVRLLTSTRGKRDDSDRPTAANIRKALDAFLADKRRGDTVLIALAGHGVQLNVSDPEDKQKPNLYRYFCPSDADLADKVSHSTGHAQTLINMDDLFARLGTCGASTKLVFVDACRNELAAESSTRNFDVDSVKIPQGVGALFSCGKGQTSWESKKLRHGVFFHYVLQGLRGEADIGKRGQVSFNDLFSYVSEKVPDDINRLVGGGAKQTPTSMAHLSGPPPVLVRLTRSTSKEKTRPEIAKTVSNRAFAGENEYRRAMNAYLGEGEQVNWPRSVQLLEEATGLGNPMAKATLAWCLFAAQGTEGNPGRAQRLAREAMEELRSSAEMGNAEAQNLVGLMYHNGLGVARNPDEALRWYEQSANQNFPLGLHNLGAFHDLGQGVPRNPAKAAGAYRRAADQGLVLSMYALANLYIEGAGVKRNLRHAFTLHKKAADRGFYHAQARLGIMYQRGEGVARNVVESARLFRLAAERGNVDAQNSLGEQLERGEGTARDIGEAIKFYRTAAEVGLPEAQHNLARMYRDGQGVPKDPGEAAKWFRKAADQNHIRAMYNLGVILEKGRGVAKNERGAGELYRRSAELNYAPAQNNLGTLFYYGKGVAKDLAEATRWYKKSALQGFDWGQYNYGWMLEQGEGTLRNEKLAMEFYRKAAGQGHSEAQYRLGRIYHQGNKIVKPDPKQSRDWLKKAAAQRHPAAIKLLREIGG